MIVLKVLGIIVLGAVAAIVILILGMLARVAWLQDKKFRRVSEAVDQILKEVEHEQSGIDGEADKGPGCEDDPEPDDGGQVHTGGGPAL